ncbi:MAG: 16S rRNA (guanine(527)-N(7))-methyltransferase RsmG [Acidobacteriia bacterium]|nr:16S rRNA (guanine(527)-N(7))-methyltransferase RsmG [Terriglobia bacterium]
MAHLSDDQIARHLKPYGVKCTPALCEQVRAYVSLLLQWNRKISLTTIIDPIEIVKFHFGECMFAVSAVPILSGRMADVGSGPGFPGLPIRMAATELDLTLIESNTKRAIFLAEVIRTTHLDHVTVFRGRMEDLGADIAPFDFITARALGQHDELLSWAQAHLAARGKIVLWLGEDDAALLSQKPLWSWQLPIHIPGSQRRCLLVGAPL